MGDPKISIIIPLYKKSPYFLEAVEECLGLDYSNFEILIGVDSDTKLNFNHPKIKIIRTKKNRTGPAEKRDMAAYASDADYIAFLDDDSYPDRQWLANAVRILRQQSAVAVCGPGLTPPADSLTQKLTGAVLASPFGSGPYAFRFVKKHPRFVDDYPAYNLIVGREALVNVGGYGTKFYGGEDTALCLKLINAGQNIYYHPEIVVYHHRRNFPYEYMKQVGNVGLHRGYFVKAYPSTSLRPAYFGPALLVSLIPFLGLFAFQNQHNAQIIFSLMFAVYSLMFIEALRREKILMAFVVPFAILTNYIAYGVRFINGLLFTKNLTK